MELKKVPSAKRKPLLSEEKRQAYLNESLEFLRNLNIGKYWERNPTQPTEISHVIEDLFSYNVNQSLSRGDIAELRGLVATLLRIKPHPKNPSQKMPYPEIGEIMGYRNHVGALDAFRRYSSSDMFAGSKK